MKRGNKSGQPAGLIPSAALGENFQQRSVFPRKIRGDGMRVLCIVMCDRFRPPLYSCSSSSYNTYTCVHVCVCVLILCQPTSQLFAAHFFTLALAATLVVDNDDCGK